MDQTLLNERASRRHALARIENLIKQTPSYHVESPDLKAAGIRHIPLSLEVEGDSKHYPRFFKPYQEELPLPKKEDEDKFEELEPDPECILSSDTRLIYLFLHRHFNKCFQYAYEEHTDHPPPSGVYRELGDYKFGLLMESFEFEWYAVSVTDYPFATYPHIKIILESEAIGDDRLLRGEIMTITDVMAARLRLKSLRPHIVAPILLVSLMGPRHARVLEADFDGTMLNIRASKLYDFTKRNTDATQLMARYWLGDACGQTMMKTT